MRNHFRDAAITIAIIGAIAIVFHVLTRSSSVELSKIGLSEQSKTEAKF